MANITNSSIDNQQLLSIIERIENLKEDAKNIANDIKEVMSEAKSAGYDPKYIRQMLKLRQMDPDQISEQDEITQIYRNALGL